MGGSIRSLSFTEEIVELVMLCRSVSRPASGRFAVNQWTQLTLTRRGLSVWDTVGGARLGVALTGGAQIDLDQLRDLVAHRSIPNQQ